MANSVDPDQNGYNYSLFFCDFRLYDSMLNCGVNVTHAFGNPCTVEQVERAVLEGNMSAIIQGLDPDICPGLYSSD